MVKQILQLYIGPVVDIINRHGLSIDVHCRSQLDESTLALYKPLIHFNSYLKHLYVCNKMKHLKYEGGCGKCGHIRIKALK